MDINYTQDQVALRDSVRKFCEVELQPHYQRWDRESHKWLPDEFMQKIIDMGLLHLRLPSSTFES